METAQAFEEQWFDTRWEEMLARGAVVYDARQVGLEPIAAPASSSPGTVTQFTVLLNRTPRQVPVTTA